MTKKKTQPKDNSNSKAKVCAKIKENRTLPIREGKQMSEKRKLVSFDWAIKALLRDKENFGILEGFLSELLFDDIKILDILEGESNKSSEDDKFNRLDVKVRNSKEEIILIEIQYDREMDYLQRMLYGSSKAIVEHMKKGMAYSNVKKVISVNILYYDFNEGDDYIYKGTTSFTGLHSHSILKLNTLQQKFYNVDGIDKIYPEYYIINVKKFDDNTEDSLDEWIYFLKNEDIKDDFNAKGLKEAKEKLDFLKMTDKERKQYEKFKMNLRDQASAYESTYVAGHFSGKIEGKREGKIEGKQEGKREGKIEIAREMIKDGVQTSMICKYTGLTLAEVEALREE